MAKPKQTTKVSEQSTEIIPHAPQFPTVSSTDAPVMSQEEMKQSDFLNNVAKLSFQNASEGRRRYDQEWLGRNLFWRGYQFSRYVPQSQTVVLTVRQSARIGINLTATYMRSIRNQVTSFRPKFEVLPTVPDNTSSQVQARYAQRLLDYYFDHLKLKMKIKETIIQALLYSIGGPWQIVYNPRTKEINIWLLDPFDFYMDPLAEDPNEAEYMIKAVRRPLGEVVNNPEYNLNARQEITDGDSSLAASPQKQFMIQVTRIVPSRPGQTAQTIILYEGFFRRYRPNGDIYMVRCVWSIQNTLPLLYEEIDTDEFDFVVYRGDLNPKEPYGESWIKHVMVINRAINALESSTLEYNSRIAKGRIVVDRDSGVRAIHNVHGEIISKNRGSEIKPLELPMLPISVQNQIARLLAYGEDIAGIHGSSLGRVPTGIRSGIAVAELKQADSVSQDDLIDNLEDFLTDVAMKMLKKIAQNYNSYKVIKDLGAREGDQRSFVAIGKKYSKDKQRSGDGLGHPGQVKIGPDWFDVAEIGDDNNIRVTVGSWLGYTKEALQQKVLSYYQMQLIDQKTALKLLEFGDIDSIIQQTRVESMLKKNLQTPPQPGEIDQLALAQTENGMLLEGNDMPVESSDDHMLHIAIHQEALGQGMDDLVNMHIEKHMIKAQSGIGRTGAAPSQDQAQPQPTGFNPTGDNNPQPQGPPAGQQLPQQNIPQAQAQNTATAGQMMSPGQ